MKSWLYVCNLTTGPEAVPHPLAILAEEMAAALVRLLDERDHGKRSDLTVPRFQRG